MFFTCIGRKRLSGNWSGRFLGMLFVGAFAASEGRSEPVEFDCVIEPQQVVKLASPVVGVISHLDVDRGDILSKGQVVGGLEAGVEAAALALARARATNEFSIRSAEARLRFLRGEHERLIKLQDKDIVSRAALQKAEEEANVAAHQLEERKLEKEVAALQVRHAEEVLAQRTLRSPIDGVVVERLLVPGEYQNEQSPVLTLAEIDPLRVEVVAPVTYYGQVRAGTIAEVRPEEPIGGSYPATVVVVDRVLDAASGTFGVRLSLPNPGLRLPAGIRCNVVFDLNADGGVSALSGGSRP
ncbi:efflux RND transporter periplasmic adaptor subunit [Taklimakanibacter deserti]|uniref:efflux RND transporter periplasmic adaptor subunit n=1 Tax=Taklimakanibacter deserti TaxID=2267839 RepID=UPI000E659271